MYLKATRAELEEIRAYKENKLIPQRFLSTKQIKHKFIKKCNNFKFTNLKVEYLDNTNIRKRFFAIKDEELKISTVYARHMENHFGRDRTYSLLKREL